MNRYFVYKPVQGPMEAFYIDTEFHGFHTEDYQILEEARAWDRIPVEYWDIFISGVESPHHFAVCRHSLGAYYTVVEALDERNAVFCLERILRFRNQEEFQLVV